MKKLIALLLLTVCVNGYAGGPDWGEHIPGVVDKINVNDGARLIALTMDLCGGDLDTELIKYLNDNNIQATLFVTKKFIDKNKSEFLELSENKLFDIQNHGTHHKPASISGKSIYGIRGFDSENGLIDEIKINEEYIYKLTNHRTTLYRSGAAYYESGGIKIINNMGYKVIGFSVNGDFGGTASAATIEKNISNANSGDIIINHANRPKSSVHAGMIAGIKKLQSDGYKFVFVKDYIK